MSLEIKKDAHSYGNIFLGAILFCAGLNLFIVPVGLYNGGTVGIAQIIRSLLEQSITLPQGFDIAGIINFIINIPLLILAYRKFGTRFFFKTVFSVIMQTILFSLIIIPSTPIIADQLTACIIGGMIAGTGVGMTLRAGGSGGGNDILGLYFAKKRKDFSVGKMTLLINGLIYVTCALLFELSTAIYSIIYSAIYSLVVDKVHVQNINTSVQVFTKKPDLYKSILHDLQRGTTYWKATGGYTDTDTYVIISVVSKFELHHLKQLLEENDPNAFVIVNEDLEVLGNYEKRL